MSVSKIQGYKGYTAFQAFNTLMLGLKMLPSYMHESWEEFLGRVQEMSLEDQKKMIREASMFVTLEEDEIKALISFCKDKNGVPYSSENLKNLSPGEVLDLICAVCFEISQFKINFVSEREKKN